ncbi:hypothetical protein RUM43_007089 [Polyplax serrata]|uniref:Ig-like domain-containing protein n=1 Tax=Polyplax serrata TaxID=468196 RepID=A0AAN8S595_POLSC
MTGGIIKTVRLAEIKRWQEKIFDVRGRSFAKALYWSDENAFGPRAYFQTVSKPAALALDSVALEDEGIYRCRVDFKNSPTRNYQVNLTVIGEYIAQYNSSPLELAPVQNNYHYYH